MTDVKPSPMNRTEGFALVLSLLFTGIVLLIVVSTAASLVTGSRQGGASERVSYQALLIAESGLNSLPRRAAEYIRSKPYTGSTKDDLQRWLTGVPTTTTGASTNDSGLRAYLNNSDNNTVITGAVAPITGDAIDSLSAQSATTFTATSTGKSGTGTKTTLQDYAVTDRNLPPGVRPNSGVISIPKVVASGSSKVVPTTLADLTTTTANATVSTAQVALAVTSVAGLRIGDYITAGGATLRIDKINAGANTLTVTKVLPSGAGSVTISKNSNVALLTNAVSQTASTVSSSMTLNATNVTDFNKDETVSVKVGNATYLGTVQSINAATKTVTITWTTTPLPASIPEGTAIGRNMLAMSSAGSVTIDPKAASKLSDYTGISSGNPKPDCTSNTDCAGSGTISSVTTSSQLTQTLFGLTDAELNDLVPLTTVAPTFPAGKDINVGILRIKADMYNQIIDSNKTYTGVIIIEDAVTKNLTGTTINGLLYLRGGMAGDINNGPKFTGSMEVNGTIAVAGSPADTTSVLSGNVTVKYNAVKLSLALSTSTGSKRLDTLAGTWRQQ